MIEAIIILATIIATPFGALIAFAIGTVFLASTLAAVVLLINAATSLRRKAGW